MNIFLKLLVTALVLFHPIQIHAEDVAPAGRPALQNLQDASQKTVEVWLKFVDAGDAKNSWVVASSLLKIQVGEEQWEKSLTSLRDVFGLAIARKLLNAQYTTTVPGAPDGQYVVMVYQTAFEKKEAALETVTLMLDSDGSWRVGGYFIQ